MLLLRHNSSLPDLDASSFRIRSSSYPSYHNIPSKQFTSSPSEGILPNYDQREDPLVESWLPTHPTSADVSQPDDAPSSLAAPSAINRSTFPPSHNLSTSATLNDPTRHPPRFLHTTSGGSSSRQSFPPAQQHPGSLSRHLSDPNIRSAVAQTPSHYPLTEQRYPQRRQPHRQSFQHGLTPVLPSPSSASFSADRRPSTAGSATSSSWEHRDTRAESLQEVPGVPDLPPIAPGDHNTSPVERYPVGFSNPFGVDSRPRSSGLDDPLQNRLHSPGSSSLVPIARPVVSEEEHETIHPDPSVSKTYSFVSLPGNAVRKRPRRRYDEIERLYHCSWIGCTKSYGTLNHLNAHIVMQRHGNKRTPAEFKELRKQWRKAKKDESERMARLERAEERYSARPEHGGLQYSQQSYERPARPFYGRQQLYGPGVPGPEMDHPVAVGELRYPSGTETPMRAQPLQPPYGYPMSGAAHSLYPVAPTTPIPPTWSEQHPQYEGSTPPQPGSAPGHPQLIAAQAAYENERERQAHSWTPPAHAASSRPYEVSSSYTQPHSQQRVGTLPPDSTLLTPLPGYQQSEYEEEYENKQQFWTEQQQQQQQQH